MRITNASAWWAGLLVHILPGVAQENTRANSAIEKDTVRQTADGRPLWQQRLKEQDRHRSFNPQALHFRPRQHQALLPALRPPLHPRPLYLPLSFLPHLLLFFLAASFISCTFVDAYDNDRLDRWI